MSHLCHGTAADVVVKMVELEVDVQGRVKERHFASDVFGCQFCTS